MRGLPARSPRTLAALTAVLVALVGGLVPLAAAAWPGLEHDTIDARFGLRGASRPSDVVVVGIDDRTFSDFTNAGLHSQWPFPRRYYARVIDNLKRAGARVIAIDIQFTEPTDPADDDALYGAVAGAGNVVLSTTEVNRSGGTDVLGGDANLRRAHAVAAATNMPQDSDGVIRSYPYSVLGLDSFAVATARAAGRPISLARFHDDAALIDFRGPPGTIREMSMSAVYRGRFDPRRFAGKIVVVGATSATLQDLHATSTTRSTPMAGAELQANAIWTALNRNPLSPAPAWLAWLAVVVCAVAAPLASLRFRVAASALIASAIGAVYLVVAQLSFDSGTVLIVSYPLVAGAVGTVGALGAHYVAAYLERDAYQRRLHESQLELIQRLAGAVESRDAETGEHTQRIGLLCRRLALEIGWSASEAQALMWASVAHDIGKIGIADTILLKAGPLDASEWETMKTHTTVGARLLAGSDNPLMQMAETIALTHHERWDGSGYPAGLAGEAIPLVGRICAVVDVYDALLSKRSYKEAWRMDDVLAEIERSSGTHFDPELVGAFLRLAPRLDDELQASFSRERSLPALRAATA
ncbi:MAG: CHASE2 domain-containing protein [Solirubrobacteraceae bacterium]|jgi:CHASE2 domain-containing sensor protein